MASRDITTSAGKESALTGSEHDQNMNGLHGTVDEKTGTTYTVLYTDQGKTIQLNNATMTCTMDAIATITAAIDTDSWIIRLKNINAAAATIDSSAETFDGAASLTLNQYDSVVLQLNAAGTQWNIIAKDQDVVDINGGTIDGVTIGATVAPTVTDLGSVATCDINGGTVDGVTIGAAVAATITGAALGTAVTAVTQSADDNSTAVATTAYSDAVTPPDASVTQAKLSTLTGSKSGNLSPLAVVSVTMNAYCFFPMMYGATPDMHVLTNHTNGNSPDLPRLSLVNENTGTVRAYNVEWRYIVA